MRKWAQCEIDILYAMVADKKKISFIASALERSKRSVESKMVSLGIRSKFVQFPEGRKPRKKALVREDGSYRPWKPADDAKLRKMRVEGLTAPEIAPILGRTVGAVRARASEIQANWVQRPRVKKEVPPKAPKKVLVQPKTWKGTAGIISTHLDKVISFLRSRDFEVRSAVQKGHSVYVLDNRPTSIIGLLMTANRHRRLMGQPEFDVPGS